MGDEQPDQKIIYEVTILLATNVTSSICKLDARGTFEIKYNIVQLFHKNGQFIGLEHENPQIYLKNILEISDILFP